ncbi:hypothetical protein [Aurantiacibacter zhengii]|nr:hypothetical protein [Aurantiacibacter zhengii]
MRAIKVDVDGTVTAYDGEEDFWMDEDTVWAEGPYKGEINHAVYYDDEAMFADVQVRATLSGVDYPLPCWIVGIFGEDTADATLSLEKVIADLGPRRYPLLDHPKGASAVA